jgi:hypothetical protein
VYCFRLPWLAKPIFDVHEVGPRSIHTESIGPDHVLYFLGQLAEFVKFATIGIASFKKLLDELKHFCVSTS